jgi:hypothetical protein
VCILRVEVEPERFIITMTVNRDIATGTTQPVTRFTDTGEATAAVAEFLASFTWSNPPDMGLAHACRIRHGDRRVTLRSLRSQ